MVFRLESTCDQGARTRSRDLLPIGEVSRRSGYAASAILYDEAEGLLTSTRTPGGRREFERLVLRRLAFARTASHVGLSLEEIRSELDRLPSGRPPAKADWARISQSWRGRLEEQIAALEGLRDGLESCIGCGCLSLRSCPMINAEDRLGASGDPGALRLSPVLRRTT